VFHVEHIAGISFCGSACAHRTSGHSCESYEGKARHFWRARFNVVESQTYCNCGHTALAQTVFMIVGAPL
jgi:hypothetical protein